MRRHERHLFIVAVTAAWLFGPGHGEAIGQRTRLLEFGPDAMDVHPRPRRAAGDAPIAVALEPDASKRPWALESAWALRLPPPPDERESARERRALRKYAAGEDADALQRVRYWDAGPPGRRWREVLADILFHTELVDIPARQALMLLDVTIDDARITAWDSKHAYKRPRPGELDARLVPEVAVSGPSYPSERAVIAGAVASVLAHLFPGERIRLSAAAHEAAWSRVVASAVYPSDAEAGLTLGRAVAARVIERARFEGTWVPSAAR
jgi:hypothetical protein